MALSVVSFLFHYFLYIIFLVGFMAKFGGFVRMYIAQKDRSIGGRSISSWTVSEQYILESNNRGLHWSLQLPNIESTWDALKNILLLPMRNSAYNLCVLSSHSFSLLLQFLIAVSHLLWFLHNHAVIVLHSGNSSPYAVRWKLSQWVHGCVFKVIPLWLCYVFIFDNYVEANFVSISSFCRIAHACFVFIWLYMLIIIWNKCK